MLAAHATRRTPRVARSTASSTCPGSGSPSAEACATRRSTTAGRVARAFVLPRSVFHGLSTVASLSHQSGGGQAVENAVPVNDRLVHLEGYNLPDGPNPSGPNIACFKRSGVLGYRARSRAANRNSPMAEVVDGVIHPFPTPPRLIEDRRRGQSVDNPANAVPPTERESVSVPPGVGSSDIAPADSGDENIARFKRREPSYRGGAFSTGCPRSRSPQSPKRRWAGGGKRGAGQ